MKKLNDEDSDLSSNVLTALVLKIVTCKVFLPLFITIPIQEGSFPFY